MCIIATNSLKLSQSWIPLRLAFVAGWCYELCSLESAPQLASPSHPRSSAIPIEKHTLQGIINICSQLITDQLLCLSKLGPVIQENLTK